MSPMNLDSNIRYTAVAGEIERLIESIEDRLAEHGATDRKNWNQVGDLNHVADKLREIDEFLGGKE